MIRPIGVRLSLLGAIFFTAGCLETRPDEPELSRRDRRIVERRKLHGKETTIQSGDWRYESKDDKWRWEPERRAQLPDDSSRLIPQHPILPDIQHEVPPPIH